MPCGVTVSEYRMSDAGTVSPSGSNVEYTMADQPPVFGDCQELSGGEECGRHFILSSSQKDRDCQELSRGACRNQRSTRDSHQMLEPKDERSLYVSRTGPFLQSYTLTGIWRQSLDRNPSSDDNNSHRSCGKFHVLPLSLRKLPAGAYIDDPCDRNGSTGKNTLKQVTKSCNYAPRHSLFRIASPRHPRR